MAIQVIFSPQLAWEYISMRRFTNLYRGFIAPLWISLVVSAFIGGWLVSADSSFELGLKNLIIEAFILFVGFHISAFLLNEYIGKLTDVEKGLKNAQVFVAYSSSLVYMVGIIVSILPDFFFLWLFSIYTFYIVYAGSEIYYRIIPEKRMNFMVIASLLIIGVPIIIRTCLSMMTA
ncbi:YIP1 family protein [Viscerimonas tarda]